MNSSSLISRSITRYHPSSAYILAFSTSCIRFLPRCSSSIFVKIKSPPLLQSQTNRANNTTQVRWHGGPKVSKDAPSITITFTNPHPSASTTSPPLTVQALVGETLLQTAQRNNVDLEGACEGVCACSTCHLILQEEEYDNLIDSLSEDEEDMLDLATGLTETSRLGCQVVVTEEMDGMMLEVPAATRNFYVDGHVPQPH